MKNKIKNYKSFADRLAETNAQANLREFRPQRDEHTSVEHTSVEPKKIGEFIHLFQEYITDEYVDEHLDTSDLTLEERVRQLEFAAQNLIELLEELREHDNSRSE